RLKERFGVEFLLGTKVTGVEARSEALQVSFEGAQAPEGPQDYERVLLAVGRRPNSDQLGLEEAGLTAGPDGRIAVDTQMRTKVPHIFAIGDLVAGPMLAHKASHEGKVAAEVAAGEKRSFQALVVPSVAYTDPEIAWVGLTETEAKAAGREVGVGRFPWLASGRALGMGRPEGSSKLLFDPESRRVLGGGIV